MQLLANKSGRHKNDSSAQKSLKISKKPFPPSNSQIPGFARIRTLSFSEHSPTKFAKARRPVVSEELSWHSGEQVVHRWNPSFCVPCYSMPQCDILETRDVQRTSIKFLYFFPSLINVKNYLPLHFCSSWLPRISVIQSLLHKITGKWCLHSDLKQKIPFYTLRAVGNWCQLPWHGELSWIFPSSSCHRSKGIRCSNAWGWLFPPLLPLKMTFEGQRS